MPVVNEVGRLSPRGLRGANLRGFRLGAAPASEPGTVTPDEIISALKKIRNEGDAIVGRIVTKFYKKDLKTRADEIQRQWDIIANTGTQSVAGISQLWRDKKIPPTKEWVEKTRRSMDDVLRVWKSMEKDEDTSTFSKYLDGLLFDIDDAIKHPDKLTNAILNATLPDSIRDKIVNDRIEIEKGLVASFNKLKRMEETLAKFPANDPRRAQFKQQIEEQKAKRNDLYVSHNEWKFWLLLLPVFADRLKGKVTPPSVKLVRQTSKMINKVADVFDQVVAEKKKDGVYLDGVQLGFALPAIMTSSAAAFIVGSLAAAAIAYAAYLALNRVLDTIECGMSTACEAAGWCEKGSGAKVCEANAKARPNPTKDAADILKYGAIAAGIGGALYVFGPTLKRMLESRR